MSVLCNWESLSNKVVVARLQSSVLRLKHENIVSIKTTHGTKTMWTVLSWICNTCHGTIMEAYTQPWRIKVHLFYQRAESHCPYILGIKQLANIQVYNTLNVSTGKPYSTDVLMAFASDIFKRISLI